MYFTKNELQDITEERLKSLVENSVCESKTLDYKIECKLNATDEKKEFLADVSAFANSEGGNLVIGVKEEEGVAVEIKGIALADTDAEILKMENLLRDGIEPRINGCEIVAIHLSDSKYVVIIFIPNSFNSPHVVNYKKRWRFYSRNSAGKYQLDIQEVKSAFIASENVADKVRNFRADRISKVLNNQTAIPLNENPKFVLHLIPLSAFTQNINLDFSKDFKDKITDNRLMRQFMTTYNFEGYLCHNTIESNYIQVFRNGIIEIVNSDLTGPYEKKKQVYWGRYENEYFRYLDFLVSILNSQSITAPYFIMFSLLNIAGYIMLTDNDRWQIVTKNEIIESNLLVPELFITDEKDLTHEFLKPIFDPVWNACGYEQSQNYDKDGKWIGK